MKLGIYITAWVAKCRVQDKVWAKHSMHCIIDQSLQPQNRWMFGNSPSGLWSPWFRKVCCKFLGKLDKLFRIGNGHLLPLENFKKIIDFCVCRLPNSQVASLPPSSFRELPPPLDFLSKNYYSTDLSTFQSVWFKNAFLLNLIQQNIHSMNC